VEARRFSVHAVSTQREVRIEADPRVPPWAGVEVKRVDLMMLPRHKARRGVVRPFTGNSKMIAQVDGCHWGPRQIRRRRGEREPRGRGRGSLTQVECGGGFCFL
jgi:hypothetical protein